MFSSEAVQEYVTHPEKKHNKIGNFATDATKECFVIYSLCDKKHDLDYCMSFKENVYRREASFYLSRSYAMAASLQYLLATTQETVR